MSATSRELAAERRRLQRQVARYRAADVVIAFSRYAEQGMSKMGLAARQLEVISHDVDSEFKPAAGPRQADPPYLLMVAEYSPSQGLCRGVRGGGGAGGAGA